MEGLEFILVVPPKRGEHELFTASDFESLYDHVTAFSLMTYDFSNPQHPGLNLCLLGDILFNCEIIVKVQILLLVGLKSV